MTQNVKAQTKVLGNAKQTTKDFEDSLNAFKDANGSYPEGYYIILNKAIKDMFDKEVLKSVKQDINFLYALHSVRINNEDDKLVAFQIKPEGNKLDDHTEAFAVFNLISAVLSEACGIDMDDIAGKIITVDKDIFVDVRDLLCTVKA